MGYTGGRIEDLFTDAEHIADRAVRSMAEAMGTAATDAARALAPVAERDPHRPPGTYKASLQPIPVERIVTPTGHTGYRSGVVTHDPIAHLIEYSTAAHVIRPHDPHGLLRFRTTDGHMVEAKVIHHPGTTGQHVVGNALAVAEQAWPEVGRAIAEEWAVEQRAAAERR